MVCWSNVTVGKRNFYFQSTRVSSNLKEFKQLDRACPRFLVCVNRKWLLLVVGLRDVGSDKLRELRLKFLNKTMICLSTSTLRNDSEFRCSTRDLRDAKSSCLIQNPARCDNCFCSKFSTTCYNNFNRKFAHLLISYSNKFPKFHDVITNLIFNRVIKRLCRV